MESHLKFIVFDFSISRQNFVIDADFHQFKRKRETRSIKILASFKE